jgi:hypothetical protein
MQAPLPTASLRRASHRARKTYLATQAYANTQSPQQLVGQQTIKTVFDYGLNF